MFGLAWLKHQHWLQQQSVCSSAKHRVSCQVMEELNPHSAKAHHALDAQPPHWLWKYSHPRWSSRDGGLYAARSGRKIKIPGLFYFWPVSLLFTHGTVKPREVSVRNWSHYALNTDTLVQEKTALDLSIYLPNIRHSHRVSHKKPPQQKKKQHNTFSKPRHPLGRTRGDKMIS